MDFAIFQLIATYSSPPPPPGPESTELQLDMGASYRVDFKDPDMKRLSMEIERERYKCGVVTSQHFNVSQET